MPELLELLKLLELPKLLKLTGARVPAGAASARQGERAAGCVGGRRRSGGSRGRREHRRRVQPETLRRAARGKSGEVLNLLREPKAGQGSRRGRSESQWDERREAEELAVASPRALTRRRGRGRGRRRRACATQTRSRGIGGQVLRLTAAKLAPNERDSGSAGAAWREEVLDTAALREDRAHCRGNE